MKAFALYALAAILYLAAFLVLGDFSGRALLAVALAGGGGSAALYALAFRVGWTE